MGMKNSKVVCLLLFSVAMTLQPHRAHAAVADSSELGFTVNFELNIAAPPERVYRKLVHSVGQWWDSKHTFSGDAANMYMEERAGGCFCERLQGGGSVQHMKVIFADAGKTLRLSGVLGPLQTAALAGSMSWDFEPTKQGTLVKMRYTVGGYLPGGFEGIPEAVDRVLSEQIQRLKRFVETGRAAGS
jgi:uncharacterized protein YndB with AHSA1/START domain